MVVGITILGKTVWVNSLLQQAQEVAYLPPERIVWCYSQWQPAYMELMVTEPNIEFVKGIPSELENGSFLTSTNAIRCHRRSNGRCGWRQENRQPVD